MILVGGVVRNGREAHTAMNDALSHQGGYVDVSWAADGQKFTTDQFLRSLPRQEVRAKLPCILDTDVYVCPANSLACFWRRLSGLLAYFFRQAAGKNSRSQSVSQSVSFRYAANSHRNVGIVADTLSSHL
jgi:hypothetical protein